MRICLAIIFTSLFIFWYWFPIIAMKTRNKGFWSNIRCWWWSCCSSWCTGIAIVTKFRFSFSVHANFGIWTTKQVITTAIVICFTYLTTITWSWITRIRTALSNNIWPILRNSVTSLTHVSNLLTSCSCAISNYARVIIFSWCILCWLISFRGSRLWFYY